MESVDKADFLRHFGLRKLNNQPEEHRTESRTQAGSRDETNVIRSNNISTHPPGPSANESVDKPSYASSKLQESTTTGSYRPFRPNTTPTPQPAVSSAPTPTTFPKRSTPTKSQLTKTLTKFLNELQQQEDETDVEEVRNINEGPDAIRPTGGSRIIAAPVFDVRSWDSTDTDSVSLRSVGDSSNSRGRMIPRQRYQASIGTGATEYNEGISSLIGLRTTSLRVQTSIQAPIERWIAPDREQLESEVEMEALGDEMLEKMFQFHIEEYDKAMELCNWEAAASHALELGRNHRKASERSVEIVKTSPIIRELVRGDPLKALRIVEDGAVMEYPLVTTIAFMNIREFEQAKNHCIRLIKDTREKGNEQLRQTAFYLMTEICRALNDSAKAAFYQAQVDPAAEIGPVWAKKALEIGVKNEKTSVIEDEIQKPIHSVLRTQMIDYPNTLVSPMILNSGGGPEVQRAIATTPGLQTTPGFCFDESLREKTSAHLQQSMKKNTPLDSWVFDILERLYSFCESAHQFIPISSPANTPGPAIIPTEPEDPCPCFKICKEALFLAARAPSHMDTKRLVSLVRSYWNTMLIYGDLINRLWDTRRNYNPLHIAALEENLPVVRELLNFDKINIDYPVKGGIKYTALHLACKRNKGAEVVRELLRHGASPCARPIDVSGVKKSPLLFAVLSAKVTTDNFGIIDALLSWGADLDGLHGAQLQLESEPRTQALWTKILEMAPNNTTETSDDTTSVSDSMDTSEQDTPITSPSITDTIPSGSGLNHVLRGGDPMWS